MGYQALLFCPDEKTARTVTQVLNDLDFTVERCNEPFAAVKKLMAQHFDAVVVDCDNEQNATLLFKSSRNSAANQASLAVAVVEGQAGVAKAFRIGANLVLTKPINVEQAKGTLRVARGLLRKGGEAGKATTATSSPTASATPRPAAPAPRPAVPAPTTQSTVTRKPMAPAPVVKPTVAPLMPAMAASAQIAEIEDADSDTILEADIDETPASQPFAETKPAPAMNAGASAGTSKFPWQPSPKMAEPMASALRRAAEAVGQVEEAEAPVVKPTPAPAPEKRPMTGAMFQAQASAAAAAPAIERTASPVMAPAIQEKPARPAAVEKVSLQKSESSSAAILDTTRDEPAPPTFFPGAYDENEEEGGGKTKAIVIVAAVVLLACSAGYLSYKNMNSGKSAAAATPAVNSAPAPAASTSKPAATESTPAPQPVATDITLAGGSDASSASATHTSATKPSPKTPATKTSSDSDSEPEVVQRLIVKQDAAHSSKPAASQDAEPVQAPSAIGMGATADTKTLASIGNAPVNVPKATPQTLKVSQGVMEGLVIKRVQPRYPTQALQMRIQGPVQLQATITKDGDIQNLKVVSGDLVLARAAQEAVKQWKYKPYFLNGEPVAIETQILVNFRLPN